MPRVPSYDGRQVATDPLPGVRRQPVDERDFAGEAWTRLGEVAARAGAGVVSEAFQRERDRADQVANLTTLRQLNDLDHQVLNDPEKGILNRRGLAVMEGRESAITTWDEQAGMIAANLKTDRQRLYFEQQKTARRARLVESIDQHGVAELRRHDDTEFRAFLDSSQGRASTNASNPRIVTEALAEQEAAIRDYAKRNTLGPEATQQLLEASRNKTWSAAITQNLASGNAAAARTYFEEAKEAGLLTGEALTNMEAAVKKGAADIEGERAAAEIWQQLGPAPDNDTTAISIDKMETAARDRFANDPDTLKATIAALRTRKQGVDAGRQERREATVEALWGRVLEGGTFDQVRGTPEFHQAPEKLQVEIRDYYRREAEHAENRGYTREQREYLRGQRRQQELEEKGWAEYWELADPTVLRTLTRPQILAKFPTLGRDHVNRLLTEQEQLRQHDDQVRTAAIDDVVFKEEAYAAGLDYAFNTGDDLSPAQRANLGKLLAHVKTEIARRQQAAGKVLTLDEKRDVVRKFIDGKVMFDRSFWYDRPGIGAAVANPDDQARAYVPIAEIPPHNVREAINFLRSTTPAYQRLSDDAIKARARRAIERAYAAKVMGLGSDAELERLRDAR
jgi:hypothetical protein